MTGDQVPDWIVGYYLGGHILNGCEIKEDGTIEQVPLLVYETDEEGRKYLFRQAIQAFRDEFDYPPSMVQIGDAGADIWTLEKLASGELPNDES